MAKNFCVKMVVSFYSMEFIFIGRYIDQMKFAAYMAVSLITFFSHSSGYVLCHCIYGCMFCTLLFNFVNYIFLLLCYVLLLLCYVFVLLYLHVIIVTYVLFWVLCFFMLFCVLFVCVMCTVLLSPGVNPFAANKCSTFS